MKVKVDDSVHLLDLQADRERMEKVRDAARKRHDEEQWNLANQLINSIDHKINKIFGRK